jgi:succinate dehydrogenase / fumarate reductase membrane anchor subunit
MSDNKTPSYRSDLGRVRGLGSAKHGTGHWWALRLTSLALIPLSLWFIVSLIGVMRGDYMGARQWLHSPVNATLMILLLAVGFHHAANGVQVVIEDYVHREAVKNASIIIVKFVSALLALAGIVATLRILFVTV